MASDCPTLDACSQKRLMDEMFFQKSCFHDCLTIPHVEAVVETDAKSHAMKASPLSPQP